MISLFLHLHTPFPPSLISMIVSLDVKHHVYLILEKQFSRGSSRDSNTRPFDPESGALTTELSLLPLKAENHHQDFRSFSSISFLSGTTFPASEELSQMSYFPSVAKTNRDGGTICFSHFLLINTHTHTRTHARTLARTHARTQTLDDVLVLAYVSKR